MKYFLSLFLVSFSTALFCQFEPVVYDHEKNYFNEGQLLPEETYIMMNGAVPMGIDLIEIEILNSNSKSGKTINESVWKRTDKGQNAFHVPINYKLRQNSTYGFAFKYYRLIQKTEKAALRKSLTDGIVAYIDQSISIRGNEIKFSKSAGRIQESLDLYVNQGTDFYRNNFDHGFPGFSEIVKEKLKELQSLNLNDNRFYIFKGKEEPDSDSKAKRFEFFQDRLGSFKTLVESEITQYVNTIQYILIDTKEVNQYSTEKGKFILPVNAGYGMIYNSGDLENLSYGSSPYLGLSFPLGNSALKKNILSESSISIGVYTNNFRDQNDQEITGPVVQRPLFLGVGTRAFKLFRFNAGITTVQKSSDENGLQLDKIYFRPSFNISIEIGIWLGLLK